MLFSGLEFGSSLGSERPDLEPHSYAAACQFLQPNRIRKRNREKYKVIRREKKRKKRKKRKDYT